MCAHIYRGIDLDISWTLNLSLQFQIWEVRVLLFPENRQIRAFSRVSELFWWFDCSDSSDISIVFWYRDKRMGAIETYVLTGRSPSIVWFELDTEYGQWKQQIVWWVWLMSFNCHACFKTGSKSRMYGQAHVASFLSMTSLCCPYTWHWQHCAT